MTRGAPGREAFIGGLALFILGTAFLVGWSLILRRLGPADARAYLVLRGLVNLAGALVPVTSVRWVQAHPALVASFAKRMAIAIELCIAAAMTVLLVATSRWWAARAGIAAPAPWVIAAAALHQGAMRVNRAIIKLGVLPVQAVVTSLGSVAQLSASLLFALAYGHLGFVVIGAALASMAITAVALRVPPRPADATTLPRPLVSFPAWIADVSQAVPRVAVAIGIAGVMLLPYESAGMLAWLLFMPFMAMALPDVTGVAPKLTRGVLLAAGCFFAISFAGPSIYALIFPRWFGGAALVRSFAPYAFALIPLSHLRKRKGEPDWRTSVAAATALLALAVLVPQHGVVGVIEAGALKLFVGAVLGIADPTRREEQLLG
ncbi:MAG: hypothetical protein JO257_38210 [Deltaproteobacteria bacterium]|nr:hypothetical protein [Deltaproteobacteria bacterium]